MTRNVGGKDKTARIILGVVLIGIALLVSVSAVMQIVLFVIAAIALVSAFVGFCPLNQALGINTCDAD